MYYPDDSGNSQDKKCVQDCKLGSDLRCGGIIEYVGITNLYDSVEECCESYFTWLDTDYCVDNSSELLFLHCFIYVLYIWLFMFCSAVFCRFYMYVWGRIIAVGREGKDGLGCLGLFHNHYFWSIHDTHNSHPPSSYIYKILTRLARADTFKIPPVADTASRTQLHARAQNYAVVPPPPQSYTMTLSRVVHHTPEPIRNYANRKVPECYIPTNGSFHHPNVPRIVIPRQQGVVRRRYV